MSLSAEQPSTEQPSAGMPTQPAGLERYTVIRELGQRPGRRTVLALDEVTQRQVVLKLLTFGDEVSWVDVKRFKREAEALKSLCHLAIPDYLDYFEFEDDQRSGFALVQAYINAPTLTQRIESQPLNEKELHDLAQQLLKILNYLHQRRPSLIHRDLKPSNILWNRTRVYLVDFGAVQTVIPQAGATVSVVGTYGYMAPEQFGGEALPASDLYGLGATLIYAATGKHPAELPQKALRIQFEAPQLSLGLCRWLRQMTAPAAAERFVSAKDALTALDAIPLSGRGFYQMLRARSLPPIPDGSPVRARWGEDYLEIEIEGVRPWLRHERLAVTNPLLQWLKNRKINQTKLNVAWGIYFCCLLILVNILIRTGSSFIFPWNILLSVVVLTPLFCCIALIHPDLIKHNRSRPQADGATAFSVDDSFGTRLVIDAHQVTVFQFQQLADGKPEQLLYRLRRSLIWRISLRPGPNYYLQLSVGNQVLKLLGSYKDETRWLCKVLSKVLELPLEQ